MNMYESIYPFILSLILSVFLLLITIIPVALARYSKGFKYSYLKLPRKLYKKYPSWGKRAYWAHINSLESFAIHSPALIMASVLLSNGLPVSDIAMRSALIYPLFRCFYVGMFIFNKPILRSFFWGAGLGSSLLIYYGCINL